MFYDSGWRHCLGDSDTARPVRITDLQWRGALPPNSYFERLIVTAAWPKEGG